MNIPSDEFRSSAYQHIWLLNGLHERKVNNSIRRISEEEEEMTIAVLEDHHGINSNFQLHSIATRARAPRAISRCAARTSSTSRTNNVVNINESTAQSILDAAYEVLDHKFEKRM